MTTGEPDGDVMTYRAPARPTTTPVGITAYGCAPDEADLFRELADSYSVDVIVTDEAVTFTNVGLAAGNRCISVGHKSRIAGPTLVALREAGVRYISTRSSGHDHLDTRCAAGLGISVGNVEYSPDSVADFTLMLMLMTLRNTRSVLARADRHDYRLDETRGRELRDMTVGVVGTGRIGTAVIDRLRGFGCTVLASDRRPKTSAGYVGLDELLRRSDLVTLHTPLTADTTHLLNRDRIGAMKPGAYVVNTGRGALIDTGALVEALESGRLGGAALDVVEGEEGVFYVDCRQTTVERSLLVRLQSLPNVVVTPHTAYYTDRALRDTVTNSIVNCLNFEREHTACRS